MVKITVGAVFVSTQCSDFRTRKPQSWQNAGTHRTKVRGTRQWRPWKQLAEPRLLHLGEGLKIIQAQRSHPFGASENMLKAVDPFY